MSKENPKYQQVLVTAKDLFWKFGVKRVSIEEICRESKVSKMTFYKFFSNKKELAVTILNQEIGKSIDEFRVLVKSDKPFAEKVHEMFLIKHRAAKDISSEFISDLYKNPELGLHTHMEKMAQESMLIFVEFLEDSKVKGLIRKEVTIEFILAYQASLTQMLDDKLLMSKYTKTEDLVMEAMNILFYGIVAKNE